MTISWTLATPHGNDARMSPGYTNLNQGASMYSGNVSIAESYESCHPAEIPESLPCLPSYPSQVQGRAVDLSLPVTDQYVLPPKAVVVDLINAFTRYCGYGGPAESVSAIGGIYHWFDSQQLAVDIDSIYNFNEAPGSLGHSPLCMVNAILALSCQFLATSREDHAQMGKPTGTNWHAWTESTSNRSSSMSGSISPVSHMYAPSSPGPATSRSTPESASFGPGRRKQSSTSDLHLQPGIIYFARAKSLLDNPCDEPSLSTMRVLSLFSSLLLSLSQWDLAYHYIGLAVRIAVAHGLHRKKQRADIANSPSGYFDADERTEEERKRSFWNVYILDR